MPLFSSVFHWDIDFQMTNYTNTRNESFLSVRTFPYPNKHIKLNQTLDNYLKGNLLPSDATATATRPNSTAARSIVFL